MIIFLILFGKLILLTTKIFRLGVGGTWPGEVVLKLNKNFLKKMALKLDRGVIIISGTNGKTTTAKMISSILVENKLKILNNPSGANLLNGIASAFIKDAKFNGKLHSDLAVLEIDEGNLPKILEQITPKIILLLNLSRDQLDRYGEVEIILERWIEAINKISTDTKIVLNVEDIRLQKIKDKIKNQIISFSSRTEHNWPCNLPGEHNQLNTHGAVEVAKLMNTPFEIIFKALKNFKPAFGRGEIFEIENKKIQMFLAKNPASFNNNLEMILERNVCVSSILFILNDNIPDGRDVSWIYDIDPDKLKMVCANKKIFVSGTRHSDMLLRLKYAGINYQECWNSSDIEKMIQTMIQQAEENDLCLILPTYSAMLEARKVLCGRKIL